MEEIALLDLEGDEKIDITKPMEVSKFLKSRVSDVSLQLLERCQPDIQ